MSMRMINHHKHNHINDDDTTTTTTTTTTNRTSNCHRCCRRHVWSSTMIRQQQQLPLPLRRSIVVMFVIVVSWSLQMRIIMIIMIMIGSSGSDGNDNRYFPNHIQSMNVVRRCCSNGRVGVIDVVEASAITITRRRTSHPNYNTNNHIYHHYHYHSPYRYSASTSGSSSHLNFGQRFVTVSSSSSSSSSSLASGSVEEKPMEIQQHNHQLDDNNDINSDPCCPPPITHWTLTFIKNTPTTTIAAAATTTTTTTTSSMTDLSDTAVTRQDLFMMKPGEYISTLPITIPFVSNYQYHHHPTTTSTSTTTSTTTTTTTTTTNHQYPIEYYTFRIHLYPFGRNSIMSHTNSYLIQQFNHDENDKKLFQSKSNNNNVLLYIEFLPQSIHQTIDASFTMRLLGSSSSRNTLHRTMDQQPQLQKHAPEQEPSPKPLLHYALEWKAGMRFVHVSSCQLYNGQANDFGTAIMRSYVLPSFFSVSTCSNSAVSRMDTGNTTTTTTTMDHRKNENDNNNNATNNNNDTTDNEPIRVELDLQLHSRPKSTWTTTTTRTIESPPPSLVQIWNNVMKQSSSIFQLRDIRLLQNNHNYNDTDHKRNIVPSTVPQEEEQQQQEQHDTEQVRVGRIVVPLCTKLSQRANMFQLGIYPGVEYRIMRIHNNSHPPLLSSSSSSSLSLMSTQGSININNTDTTTTQSTDVFYSQPGVMYDLKPIYPLVKQLERPWPVTVYESDIPKLCTPYQYNVISAIGSLFTAMTGLVMAFIVSQCISLYYIPSKSMDPTLQVGDVLLVEKISPKINHMYRPNDVVLFNPPRPLQDIVARSGGTIDQRSLFVKRVAGIADDSVTINPTGTVQIISPDGTVRTNHQRRDVCDTEPTGLIKNFLPTTIQERVVPPHTVEVLGDCSSVSIDSRVWGVLPIDQIVGRPIVRLWPVSKFGRIPQLPTTQVDNEIKVER